MLLLCGVSCVMLPRFGAVFFSHMDSIQLEDKHTRTQKITS